MKKTLLLVAVLSLIMVITSCQKAEEVMVSKYFQAMQHDDRETMSAMAYEPKDIKFTEYEVLSIEEPKTQELQLPGLLKKEQELEKQRKDQVLTTMDKQEELDELMDELDETRRASKKRELNKKIEELEVEVEEDKAKVKSLQLELNKTKKAIEREKALITLSTGMRENLEMFSGDTQLSSLTAKITLESGEQKDFIFLLRKDILRLQDREQVGRQIIVKMMTTDEYKKSLEEEKEEEKVEEVTEPEPATTEEGAEEKPAEGEQQ